MNTIAGNAKAIFLVAVEEHQPDEWPKFLDEACGSNHELRRRVEELLQAHKDENSLIDRVDATVDPETEYPGQVIGPYKLREKLGEGGFGIVWAAEQREAIRRKVALKVIKPGMDTASVIARFEAERQALAMMDHPNIAQVLDAGTTDQGRPFFVMELIPGTPITEFCDENALDVRERLKLFTQVCRAVQHAHQKGIVHRDIKPSNVLVTRQDDEPVLKIIDFGVAKALYQPLTSKSIYTGIYQAIGTLAYMSPEQAEPSASDIDTRADIYGLGVLLYELLTGSTPFDKHRLESAAFHEACRIIREEDPPRASTKVSTLGETAASVATQRKVDPQRLLKLLRGDLDVIAMKSLEKDRRRRYDTANELAKDIERYLHHENVLARRPTVAYRLQKMLRRNAVVVATSSVVFAALIIGIIGLLIGLGRAWIAEDRAASALTDARESLANEKRMRVQVERQRYNRSMSAAFGALGDRDMNRVATLVSELTACHENRPHEFELRYLEARLAESRPDDDFCFTEDLSSVEYSPDGGFIAVGFRQGRVLLINRATREQVELVCSNRIRHMWGPETPMKFSCDGEYLAIGGEDRQQGSGVRLWKWRSREPASVFVKHDGSVECVAVSADGILAASGDSTGRVKVWRIADGHVEWDEKGHLGDLRDIAFAPDGKTLASVALDHRVLLWEVSSGAQLASLPGHTAQLYGVGFSPDGKILVSAGELRTKLWDLSAVEPVDMAKDVLEHVEKLRFIPGGSVMVTANGNGSVKLRDVQSGKNLISLPHDGRVYGVAISPLGNQIASISTDRRLKLWNWKQRHSSSEIEARPHFFPPLAVSPKSKSLALVGQEGELQIWHPETGKLETIASSKGNVTALAISPNGKMLASADFEGVIQLWDLSDRTLVKKLPGHTGSIYGLAFSPTDGDRLASSGLYEEVRIWNIESGDNQVLKKGNAGGNGNLSVAISPDGSLLASGGPFGKVIVWDISGDVPKPTQSFQGSRRIYALVFSPDGKSLATTDDYLSGSIMYCNLETGNVKIWKAHASSVLAITFDPNDNRLITGSADRSIKFWDVASGEEVGAIRTKRQVQRLMFLRGGETLVSAGLAGYVRLWTTELRHGATE